MNMDEERYREGGNDRRTFLKAVLMVGMTGAAGATTWWVTHDGEIPAGPVVSPTAAGSGQAKVLTAPTVEESAVRATATLQAGSLTDSGADLRSELAAALGQVDSLTAELAATRSRTADLEAQLASTEGRAGILGGLVALYSQLDDLALDEVVEGGLDELGFWLTQALNHVPILRRGLTAADRMLGELEGVVPSFGEGIGWLQGLVNRLADALQSMEDALEETVEPLQPLAAKLAEFAAKILGWMPFGVGKGVQRGLDGILGVLTHVPELVRGVDDALLTPLAAWFGGDDDRPAIQTGLIDPVKQDALQPAGRLAADVEVVDQQLAEKLVNPVRAQLSARKPVRDEIDRYKAQYGL